ncbi:MAG TPA: thiolase family protein [Acidimicrobiales bacterium]|nr:thiolase family protein [Acidimicrobiales bacterium]
MSEREIAIAGVGMTRFTRQADRGHRDLVEEAVTAALTHSGLAPSDIQATFCASVAGGAAIGQRTLKNLGLAGRPIVNVENACASGSTALIEAQAWLLAGFCDVALAVGVEILSASRGPLAVRTPGETSWIFETGLNLPGWYALKASRHMNEHGLTLEQLASVVVKNRRLATLNPYAHFRSEVTAEEVLGSPMIASPLTLYQCCPKVDGAAAVIVCTADFAARHGLTPVWVRARALTSGTQVFTDAPEPADGAHRAAALAYERAGLGPEDLDVAECHDAFSIGEILYTEALGLCADGDGGRYIAEGSTSPGGKGPVVNPSGGLLSRGHPLGASGLGQVAEVVWHLRGEAGSRQVPEARIGAVHTMGGSEFELDSNACSVHILERA